MLGLLIDFIDRHILYVRPNVEGRPVKDGPTKGVVYPYYTQDGVPVAFTRTRAKRWPRGYGWRLKPPGMKVKVLG